MITAIDNARIFDGEAVLDERLVVIDGPLITRIGGEIPPDAEVIDAEGQTLLPGLIDSHVHTSRSALALALQFGVTTELEMQGTSTRDRADIAEDDSVADVRSAGFGLTPPGGHPSELFGDRRPDHDGSTVDDTGDSDEAASIVMPFVTTPEEAVAFIPRLVETGSDYIKFMIDDGTVEGHPGLPMLTAPTVAAGVAEAHRLGMLTVAHALTIDATRTAVESGIDGLAHLFMDRPHTPAIIDLIARSGVFVVPCVVLNASMMGISAAEFAADPRVDRRLDDVWRATLRGSFDRYHEGDLDAVLTSVMALHAAGVDLLVGTDVSVPFPSFGGLAHGASVHHELQMFVRAGLAPMEALRAATSTPARRFGLNDRGRVAVGKRADLLLVDGDPTETISDTLNIRTVWRRGTMNAAG